MVTGAFNQMVISIRQYLERLRAEYGNPAFTDGEGTSDGITL
ncbi:MAG: hypothetical protein ACLU77_15495 [Waltera sp.]